MGLNGKPIHRANCRVRCRPLNCCLLRAPFLVRSVGCIVKPVRVEVTFLLSSPAKTEEEVKQVWQFLRKLPIRDVFFYNFIDDIY